MSVETIGIIGAGTMGQGIAQVCAQSGFDVVFYHNTSVLDLRRRANRRMAQRTGGGV